uniref:uncharacterized protein LOC120340776 n=1 Tax=Styela clava TaxID=7725 RepID=UPI00193A1F55|nr:uncharacterized protein LOC120340776 [Styela clava]
MTPYLKRRNMANAKFVVYQVVFVIAFAAICQSAIMGVDPTLYEDSLEELERMYFPERYEAMKEDYTIPILGDLNDDVIHENTRGFKNPFVIKRDDDEEKRGKNDQAKHFYKSPFVLKRNQYQMPLILKERFKNPFAFRSVIPDVRAMYQNPSIFRRLAEEMNAVRQDDGTY